MSDIQAELHAYLQEKGINEMFTSMAQHLLQKRPDKPVTALFEYLQENYPDDVPVSAAPAAPTSGANTPDRKTSVLSAPVEETKVAGDSESEDDEADYIDELPPRTTKTKENRRVSVSAESVDPNKLAEDYEANKKVYPKTEEEVARITAMVEKNFIFQGLDEKGTKIVVDAIFPVPKEDGDVIIQQGDEGDNFYIVDSGVVEIFKDDELVMTATEAMSFGELALMYNAPRAATVKAKTSVALWGLDRRTFKMIIMDSTIKRRNLYISFLEKVPILASLNDYERMTVADALMPATFQEGDVVIRQGDNGDAFYIIEEGAAVCSQVLDEGEEPMEIARLGTGTYFGEVALLSQRPRQATVTAVDGPLKCLSLDRATFKRVMGPLSDIMKRNMEKYNLTMTQGI